MNPACPMRVTGKQAGRINTLLLTVFCYKIFILFVSFSLRNRGNCQMTGQPNIIPPSSRGSALTKYLDYPVSNSTDIPSLNKENYVCL